MMTRLATCVLGPALACGLVGAEDAFLFVNSGQALGNNSLLVALGDLDGDGDLDAMFANSGPNTVWTNDGTGNFTNSGQELGNSDSLSVALGDLDGDGDLDAMVGNESQPNTVWTNDGNGTFSKTGQALGNSRSTSVALGDLDLDGDVDAMVANGAEIRQPNTVWRNEPSNYGLHLAITQLIVQNSQMNSEITDLQTDIIQLQEIVALCCAQGNCPADLNGDGVVDGQDLATVLAAWGLPCDE